MSTPKRVVSVSLGSSKRNKRSEVELLGVPFSIERVGTDGDLDRFARMFAELDGKVDALGVGGADVWVVVGEKRYAFKQIARLISGAKQTPVVDGSGLKHTLERETLQCLQQDGIIDFASERVLLVSAVDRYGMAQTLSELCPHVIYGDLLFGVGLPIRLAKYESVKRIGALLLPIITRLPFKWFYPTGKKQEVRKPKFASVFDDASVIAGDSLYICRYAPDRLEGKTIITQSLRERDFAWLKEAGVKRVITTTPIFGGETFATNVMEGVLITLIGKRPEELVPGDYLAKLKELGWKPNVVDL